MNLGIACTRGEAVALPLGREREGREPGAGLVGRAAQAQAAAEKWLELRLHLCRHVPGPACCVLQVGVRVES